VQWARNLGLLAGQILLGGKLGWGSAALRTRRAWKGRDAGCRTDLYLESRGPKEGGEEGWKARSKLTAF